VNTACRVGYRDRVRYDAIVVGLGAMGAATLAAFAARGQRVLGLERFPLPHARGSSQGGTRIIREAYFEHPFYVPLVRRAYEGWHRLEARTGRRLIVPTGGLTIGPPDGRLVSGARASVDAHGVAHDLFTAGEVHRRHPSLRIPEGAVAVADPRAGVLLAARALGTLLDVARADGAEVRDGAPIDGWDAGPDGPAVSVDGETIRATRLVLAAGPWMPALVPALAPVLQVERNVVHWFPPADVAAGFGPDRLPVLVVEDAPDRLLYAIPAMDALGPDLEAGVKFARHHTGVFTTADTVDRDISAADVDAIRDDATRYLPGLAPAPLRSAVCCYTNAPDGHFIVDRHPAHPAVTLVSACSGHGFKFASALGPLIAEFAAGGNVHGRLAPFALSRV
jgi:sarcosine oxidase